MRFHEILSSSSCPFEFSLKLKKKDRFPGKPPYPQLIVLDNVVTHVREIQWQMIKVRASVPESGKMEDVQIMRLVAVLEGGEEVEMQRVALPADVVQEMPVDPTRCGACGGKIPPGAATVKDGVSYHWTCLR
jgi:hypothetical protein